MSQDDSGHDDPFHAERAYVEAIEETLQQLRGKPVVMSPADLERVLDWFRRDVPLHLVLRTMETLGARTGHGRQRSRPRSLAYFEEAVEDCFVTFQHAQVGARREASTTPIETLVSVLRQAAAAVDRSGAPLEARSAASRALLQLAEGRALQTAQVDVVSTIDSDLLAACRQALTEDDQRSLDAAVECELAPFSTEMSQPAATRARELARVRLLRRRFDLPDLSLLPLFGGQFPG